jgi:SAM-dependent methyltransferase
MGKPLTEQVADFEAFVHNQPKTASTDYDASYFHDQWRAGANDYTIETRRRIEGRNPQLIKDVFEPTHVLDMGCGPGALMYLLHEVGVKVDGVDFAESSKTLAPPEVADRISIGSVTNAPMPSDKYDLVICREVFEHLSVLQVQQAIANFCRITRKYVYITTRFHPAPETLFDVTTEFDVDPTHINLMNMDMTRLLFVLQGMKRREDLERRMDWLNKGRVLVYEKA